MLEYILDGGQLMIPLIVCSLISTTVIVERFYYWFCFSINRNQDHVETTLGCLLKQQALPETLLLGKKIDFTANLLVEAQKINETEVGTAFKLKAIQKIEEMNRGMMVLSTIISLAPLLGILGTVVGIIDSFEAISKLGTNSPQAVSGGISKALITTAAGLSLSIITLVPYNYFQSRVRIFAAEAERVTTRLFSLELKDQANAV